MWFAVGVLFFAAVVALVPEPVGWLAPEATDFSTVGAE